MQRNVAGDSSVASPDLKRTRGQSTLEYAVVIAVVVAALLAMQIYMKRGVQGKMRSATDQIGDQYRPQNTTSNYTSASFSKRQETVEFDGSSNSVLQLDEIQNRFGSETVDTGSETTLFQDFQ